MIMASTNSTKSGVLLYMPATANPVKKKKETLNQGRRGKEHFTRTKYLFFLRPDTTAASSVSYSHIVAQQCQELIAQVVPDPPHGEKTKYRPLYPARGREKIVEKGQISESV